MAWREGMRGIDKENWGKIKYIEGPIVLLVKSLKATRRNSSSWQEN